MQDIKTILFDYDGTLHDATKIYIPAFKAAYQFLIDNYGAERKAFSDEDITQFLGQTPKAMWEQFGEIFPQEAKQEASIKISRLMKQAIENHMAELYDGALDVLAYLKEKGYELVFISNCRQYYLEAHNIAFELDRFFKHMVCSETYEGIQDKDRVLATLKPELKEKMVIIGDRHHDIEAGKRNNIMTIGATYGFGDASELKTADARIDDIRDLKTIF